LGRVDLRWKTKNEVPGYARCPAMSGLISLLQNEQRRHSMCNLYPGPEHRELRAKQRIPPHRQQSAPLNPPQKMTESILRAVGESHCGGRKPFEVNFSTQLLYCQVIWACLSALPYLDTPRVLPSENKNLSKAFVGPPRTSAKTSRWIGICGCDAGGKFTSLQDRPLGLPS